MQYNVNDLVQLQPECRLYKQLRDIQKTTLKVRRPHLALDGLDIAAAAKAGTQQQSVNQQGQLSQWQLKEWQEHWQKAAAVAINALLRFLQTCHVLICECVDAHWNVLPAPSL